MFKKSALIAISILLVMLFTTASFSATWQDVSNLAVNNDELVSAAKQLDSAEWSYKRSYSGFLPQLSASGSYTETIAPADTPKSYSYGLTATQSLFKGMQNFYGVKSAYANYQYTLASFRKTESDVYYSLRTAFIGLYIAQENLDLSKKILLRLKENTQLIKLRYGSGREDRGNLLATSAAQKEGESNVASAKRELELARLKLSQLTSSEIRTTDGIIETSIDPEPDFNALAEDSPSFIMAKYQLEVSEISAQNTIGEFLPSVSLSWSERKTGEEWPPENVTKSWGLNISLPIFPGGSNIADKFINDLNAEGARRDFEASRKTIRYNIEDVYRNAKDAADALDVKRIFLEAADERAKIADAKYQNGLITFDEWNRIIKDNITAQKDILRAKRSALEASAAWKNIYGGIEK